MSPDAMKAIFKTWADASRANHEPLTTELFDTTAAISREVAAKTEELIRDLVGWPDGTVLAIAPDIDSARVEGPRGGVTLNMSQRYGFTTMEAVPPRWRFVGPINDELRRHIAEIDKRG